MGIGDYLRDTKGELRHVAWPTRKQAINFTALVIGVSIFVSIFLGIFDFVFDFGLREFIMGTTVPQGETTLPVSDSKTSNENAGLNLQIPSEDGTPPTNTDILQ